MTARHETDPDHLWHYSEDPEIERFEPHVPVTNPDQPPMVWAIDDEHAPLLWFPRDCPRITFWTEDGSPADRLGRTSASRVHAMEPAWVDRMRRCQLFVYRFTADGFRAWSDADGYWVADEERTALDVAPVGDLFERHRERGIELRILDDLRPLRDAVIESGYRFSMTRMRNISPAPGEGSGTG
jgi:hypothetical protein